MENVRERDVKIINVNAKMIGQAKTAKTVSIWQNLNLAGPETEI